MKILPTKNMFLEKKRRHEEIMSQISQNSAKSIKKSSPIKKGNRPAYTKARSIPVDEDDQYES